ncbi:butyrophilin subfamily 1 member A1-like isoform X5 [Apteryx mantelli]|uniref:Butyrophilin subfamily 1 member A1-like isoform X4 n=1 Tax=Apteryx mantelli TaxID=2696672 RepID=A0ABM4FXZ4_9AVES
MGPGRRVPLPLLGLLLAALAAPRGRCEPKNSLLLLILVVLAAVLTVIVAAAGFVVRKKSSSKGPSVGRWALGWRRVRSREEGRAEKGYKPAAGRASGEMQFLLGSGCSSLANHLRGVLRYLVTLHVLHLGSAQLKVVGPGHPLTATVGQDIVLPCQLSSSLNAQSMAVRWIRHRFSETVHHYRDGEDQFAEQMREYQGRTVLSRDGLSRGSLDLRILSVRPSDDGTYVCTVEGAAGYAEATVEVEVAAIGSSLLVSLEGYQGGGIEVVCRSSGWFPEPEVLWKDPRGQRLPSVSQRHSRDERGLFEIEHSLSVTGEADGDLSCVVRNSRLGQEKESSLHISAPFFHDAHPWKVALAVMLVALLMCILGLILFSVRLFKKTEQQSRDLEEQSRVLEEQSRVLEKQSRDLEQQSRDLGEQSRDLEEQSRVLEAKTTELREQAAELAWRRLVLPVVKEEFSLDPYTAHPQLILSEDCRSVRWGETQQVLPIYYQRFDSLFCVLGREGFIVGRHWWEVEGEVGADSHWSVGVAMESLRRKGLIELSPDQGIWAVRYRKGKFEALTSPPTPLSLSPVPKRIWVCLDCTGGHVTFVNADNWAEIYSFQSASLFWEMIRPWFCVEKGSVWLGPRNSTHPTHPPHPTSSPASEASCPSPDAPSAPLLAPAAADGQLSSAQTQGAGSG